MSPLCKLVVTGLLVFIFCALTLVTGLCLTCAFSCLTTALTGNPDKILLVNVVISAMGMLVLSVVSAGYAWFVFDFGLNRILFPKNGDFVARRGCVRSADFEEPSSVCKPGTRSILPGFIASITRKLFRMSAWQAGLVVSLVLFVTGLFWLQSPNLGFIFSDPPQF